MLVCECEHPVHFAETADLPEGHGHSNHVYGLRCTYVIRGNGGLLRCPACERAGHGQMGAGA